MCIRTYRAYASAKRELDSSVRHGEIEILAPHQGSELLSEPGGTRLLLNLLDSSENEPLLKDLKGFKY